MKGIDGGYKLSELLSGRGGGADAGVIVAAVKFRSGPWFDSKIGVHDKSYEKIGVAESHLSTHGYAISLIVVVATEWKATECKL